MLEVTPQEFRAIDPRLARWRKRSGLKSWDRSKVIGLAISSHKESADNTTKTVITKKKNNLATKA